ncbi:hypothetical protein [Pedobacter sp. NJ-S-72]
MPGNFLFNILEDDQYKLWISSTRGLVCFDPLKKNFKVYTKKKQTAYSLISLTIAHLLKIRMAECILEV